jgi:hypothetical protein
MAVSYRYTMYYLDLVELFQEERLLRNYEILFVETKGLLLPYLFAPLYSEVYGTRKLL